MQKRKQVKTKVCFDEKKSACENSLYEKYVFNVEKEKKKKNVVIARNLNSTNLIQFYCKRGIIYEENC